MTAYAYIDFDDVPPQLWSSATQRVDDTSGATLVAFKGCPLVGQFTTRGHSQVEFPFPRGFELRSSLVSWFMYWGIHFRVLM